MTLLEKTQALIEMERSLTFSLERVEPWLPSSAGSAYGNRIRPVPTTMEQVLKVLAVARNYSTRTSAPAGWNPNAPVIGFSTPNPLPHQLRGGALAALELERARQTERDKKRKRQQQQEEMKAAAASKEREDAAAAAAAEVELTSGTCPSKEQDGDNKSHNNNNNNSNPTSDRQALGDTVSRPVAIRQPDRRNSRAGSIQQQQQQHQQQQQQQRPVVQTTMNLSDSSSSDDDSD
jgi:hypothetical protein